MTMRRLTSFLSDRSGAAAVEMVLILPVALALILTTCEGGFYFICEHRVVKGVRDAARYAARLDLSNYACPGATFSGSAATVQNVQNLARTGKLSGGTTGVTGWVNRDVAIAVTCLSDQRGIYAKTGGYAPRVRVSTRVVYPSIMGAMGFTSATIHITAAAQSPVIGL